MQQDEFQSLQMGPASAPHLISHDVAKFAVKGNIRREALKKKVLRHCGALLLLDRLQSTSLFLRGGADFVAAGSLLFRGETSIFGKFSHGRESFRHTESLGYFIFVYDFKQVMNKCGAETKRLLLL